MKSEKLKMKSEKRKLFGFSLFTFSFSLIYIFSSELMIGLSISEREFFSVYSLINILADSTHKGFEKK